jgi:hypothetical protein
MLFYYSNINLWLRTLLFIVIRVVLLPFQQVITNIEKVIRKQLAKTCFVVQMQLTIEYVRHTHHGQGQLHAKDGWIRSTRGLLFPSRCANSPDEQFS